MNHAAASRPALLIAPRIRGRADGIDFSRALFAVWVLFSHLTGWVQATQPGAHAVPAALAFVFASGTRVFQPLGETHPAVLAFIVMSGYCIHRAGFRTDRTSLSAYAVRRVFRIYPIFLLSALAGALLFEITSSYPAELSVAQTLSGTRELSPLWFSVKLTGLSALVPAWHAATFQANAPLHTVMVEMWLYAVYPLVALGFLARFSERTWWLVLVMLWAVGVGAATLRPDLQPWWHNGSLPGFLLYWWIGAKFVDPAFRERLRPWGPWLVLGWVAASVVILQGGVHWFPLAEARKVLFALVLGLLVTRIELLAWALFRQAAPIGKAGYSIYAFHAPLVLLLTVFRWPWWLTATAAIVAGMTCFKTIEEPLLRRGAALAARLEAKATLAVPTAKHVK
jgi:peptidoglycan/LPS O-acetylase OafA/YrhL